jgi:hypothetical protein
MAGGRQFSPCTGERVARELDELAPASGPGKRAHDATVLNEPFMITLGTFLVFLGAAALPVIYLLIVSRWIEPESRIEPTATSLRHDGPQPGPGGIRQAA